MNLGALDGVLLSLSESWVRRGEQAETIRVQGNEIERLKCRIAELEARVGAACRCEREGTGDQTLPV